MFGQEFDSPHLHMAAGTQVKAAFSVLKMFESS